MAMALYLSFMILLYSISWDLNIMMMSILFVYSMINLKINILYTMSAMDSWSSSLISLSIWMSILMMIASSNVMQTKTHSKNFSFTTLILMITLIMSFSTKSMIIFFIAFELSVIPTFFMIMGWGVSKERLQASLYMILYTLFASLPFLLVLMILQMNLKSLSYEYIFYSSNKTLSSIWWLYVSLVFMVKLPIFFLHLWLPKAHVEAPLAGSMILAGILLKLGGYGLIRCMNFCVKDFMSINNLVIAFSTMGGLIISLMCIRQTDLKRLVAYSSVSHMAIVISGISSFSWKASTGSLLMMLAHGLCSSGLFCVVYFVYQRMMTRSILILKSMMLFSPILSFWSFTLCLSNMSCPPSINFVSEVLIMTGMMTWSQLVLPVMFSLMLMTGVYSIHLYVSSSHGNKSQTFVNSPISLRENLILFSHSTPLLAMLMCMKMIT